MSDAIAPSAPKSWVQQFVERAKGEAITKPSTAPVAYVREAGTTVGEFAEGGVVGSLLGAAHAKFGLDTKAGPIDGLIAGMGAIASIGAAGHFPQIAAHARRIGSHAFSIFTFRKSFGLVNHTPMAAGTATPGVQRVAMPRTGPTQGKDPIEEASKGLG